MTTTIDSYTAACHHIAEHAHQHAETHPNHQRDAHTLASNAYHLANILPTAMQAINREATTHDGWPERSDTNGRTTGISRPTERLALERTATVTDVADTITTNLAHTLRQTRRANTEPNPDRAHDALLTALALARETIATCTHWLPTPDKPQRCAGTGDATGAQCGQLVDYRLGDNGTVHPNPQGRCADCARTVERRQDAERKRKQQRENRKARRGT